MKVKNFVPSYRLLLENGELEQRIYKFKEMLKSCSLCPRNCGVNREKGEIGYCRIGDKAIVASYCIHRGEEPVISGFRGSGTVFFANCNLSCLFCQNYEISQEKSNKFREVTIKELSEIYLELEESGVHNINWVSPTHIVPQAVEALYIAGKKGLSIPVVYNSNGYDSLETLKLLEGIVDIYLPDLKYLDDDVAKKLSNVSDYSIFAKNAIKEMWRQVGKLVCDEKGVAVKGLLVRHLVLPNNLSQSSDVIKFLSEEIAKNVAISLMAQYYPAYKAFENPQIDRPITKKEYEKVLETLYYFGLSEGFIQELCSFNIYRPNFSRDGHPFEDN